jgi:hypothetical protein
MVDLIRQCLWHCHLPQSGKARARGAVNKVQRNHPSTLRVATLFVKEGCAALRAENKVGVFASQKISPLRLRLRSK